MDRVKIAAELVRLAKSMVAGTGKAEFEDVMASLDAARDIVGDAMTWAALQTPKSQRALSHADHALEQASRLLYEAWDRRDKNIPV